MLRHSYPLSQLENLVIVGLNKEKKRNLFEPGVSEEFIWKKNQIKKKKKKQKTK